MSCGHLPAHLTNPWIDASDDPISLKGRAAGMSPGSGAFRSLPDAGRQDIPLTMICSLLSLLE